MATTMAISPDGRTFAYGLENRVIHIWNMDKKTSTRISMASITGVQSLSFTTDGRWLASVGEHDVIRIWNSSTGECKKEIRCQGGWKVKISGDGQWIAVGNLYRDVRVWGMKSGRLIHNFERDSNTATRDISHISGL